MDAQDLRPNRGWSWAQRRDLACGAWLGFGAALKVTPALGLLFLLWKRSGRGVLGAIVTPLPWLLAALGHMPSAMIAHARYLIDVASGWLPRTQLHWGALAIIAAFVCLVVGGLISWRRATPRDDRKTVARL